MSLQEVLRNYEGRKRQKDRAAQLLRQQIERGIEEASIQALKLQNHRVNHIHKNQQAIEGRLRRQQELLADLRKNEELWSSLYEQLNRALMQVGDIVHYAGYVQAEIGEIVGLGSVAQYLQDAEEEPSVREGEGEKPAVAAEEREQREEALAVQQTTQQQPNQQQASSAIVL